MGYATYIHGTDSAEQARLTLLNRLTNQAFIDFLSLGDVSSILEIGSGLGLLAEQIATLVPQSAVWGLEYSSDQLNVAKDRLQEQLGGDGLIGKKLLPLLKTAGFQDIALSIAPEIHYAGVPTFRPWVENLIGNVRSGV